MKTVRLGPFEIHEPVGSGGMGAVRRGIYRGPGGEVEVALKFVEPPEGSTHGFREAFVREVQSAARLHHPNIVRVFEIGEVDASAAGPLDLDVGTPFLVMEYVRGGTLDAHVGKLDWVDLRSVLLHLLDALAHAHALGIVHRDLKPANVLCDVREGGMRPMLTDFGIARAMDVEQDDPDEDEPQRVAGTPYYMAPEHVMGRWRDEGPWTDVYALGALGWHLVTGRVPFAGDTGDVLRAHLMADLPPFAPGMNVPRGFEAWLRRLLDKDLTRRYRRAADAAYALMEFPEELEPERTTRRLSAIVMSDPGPTLQGLTATFRTPSEAAADEPEVMEEVVKQGLAPPLPENWRRGNENEAATLRGAGLGLFGMRPVPIVGRDAERTMLWDGLREVHDFGEPRGIVVTGASGTGKSRLVSWLAERADEVGGAITFRATHSSPRSSSDGLVPMMTRFTRSSGLGFESVLMRVRALYSDLELRGEDALFDAVALTERILGLNPENASGPRFQSRPEWFAALVRLFGALTRERPVLLWLDDLHLSEESREFARYVVGNQHESKYPIYVVMTVPDAIEEPAGRASIEAIAAMNGVERLDLEPLSDEHVATLAKSLGLSENLSKLVVARTAGNPLFVVQLVEDWVSRGALSLKGDAFDAPPEVVDALPDDIQATWQRRVDDVVRKSSDPTARRRSLELAATLGSDVDAQEWRRAAGSFGVTIDRALVADLVGSGLATRHDTGWSFVHSMLRESILIGIDDPVEYHVACAAALDQIPTERRRARTTGRLAEHLVAAGEPRRALDVILRAVRSRRQSEERTALISLVEQAQELIDTHVLDVDPGRHGSLIALHASTLRQLGRAERARALVAQGIDVLTEGRPIAHFLRTPDEDRNATLADLLAEKAILLYEMEGDLAAAERILEQAQGLASAIGDPITLGWAAKIRSRVLCTMGRVDEGIECARRAVEAYGVVRKVHPSYYFVGLHELAGALRTGGRLDEAQQMIEKADHWRDQIGSREALAQASMERAEVARALGRFDEARAHYENSGQLFEMLGGKNVQLVELNLCLVDVEAGDLTRPLDKLRQLREELPNLGMEAFRSHSDLALAACAARVGEFEDYDANFSSAAARVRATGVRDPELAGLARICANECAARGDEERSQRASLLAEELSSTSQSDD